MSSGIRGFLPDHVRLISGPGCPVCVTDTGYIDAAIELARSGSVIVTFGDLMRAPGSHTDLARVRAQCATVHVCYSPAEALVLAAKDPDRDVVLLAIGFETTTAPIVATLNAAYESNVQNLTFLTAFKQVPPALALLLADPEIQIDALLCPGHVSAIIGSNAYHPFAGHPYRVPCVVAGFEPLDLLLGLRELLTQHVEKRACVVNHYSRVVRPEGNPVVQRLIQRYLEPADVPWRGMGVLPKSGWVIAPEFHKFDAEKRHQITIRPGKTHPDCLCGEVLKGKKTPPECSLFDVVCMPDRPVGPCMVSSEGSCAAYHKYEQ